MDENERTSESAEVFFDDELEELFDEQMAEENEKFFQAELASVFDTTQKEVIHRPVDVYLSEFVPFAVRLFVGGIKKPFSFEGRPYLPAMYDSPARAKLLKCSRQTEKSTFLGNVGLSHTCIIPGFSTLYVSPSATQTKTFSTDRITQPMQHSPEIAKNFDLAHQSVFSKIAKNGAQIRMRYAFLNADRTRGLPADHIQIDELQHIIVDNIPVIEQCLAHSVYKMRTFSGTPLSLDNPIETTWENHSTQNEWAIPCRACGQEKDRSTWHWNILGPRNIGKDGIVCARCGRSIFATDPYAHWISFQPVTEENQYKVTFEGYRITQLMVPWIEWETDILQKRETYGDAQFNNEVCGLSFDSGTRPINKHQLIRACNPDIDMSRVEENAAKCVGGIFAGIDWGQDTEKSFTVLTLGGYMSHGFQIFFAHRFEGLEKDPDLQKERIVEILGRFNVRLTGADYGGGFGMNDPLINHFGMSKFARYYYSVNPARKVSWNANKLVFVLHRTEIMTDFFSAMKRRVVRWPNWAQFEKPFGQDIRNIYSEFSPTLRILLYNHRKGLTDDTFHSGLYCLLASMIVHPRFDIIVPTKTGDLELQRPGID